MSDKDYGFDLDDILREFSSDSDKPKASPAAQPKPKAVQPKPAAQSRPAVTQQRPAAQPKPVTAQPRPAAPQQRQQPVQRPAQPVQQRPAAPQQKPAAAQSQRPAAPQQRQQPVQRPAQPVQQRPAAPQQKPAAAQSQRPAAAERRPVPVPAERRPVPAAPAPRAKEKSAGMGFITLVFIALAFLSLVWALNNIHPDSGSSIGAESSNKLDLVSKFDVYINNAASDALGDLAYIRKVYKIDDNALAGPKPNPANYGTTTDPAVIQQVIDSAADLLEGQSLAWDPNVDFYPGSQIEYYYDETILVIAWKELIDNRVCTFAEVKTADGSQVRRMIANNSYGSDVQLYPTDMAASANAVIAISGDFYTFRQLGITVYQRQLYRFAPKSVDTCFFTSTGDMLFSRAGEMSSQDEAQQFITDNDVTFAVAFGPVMVEDGQAVECSSYPIGEVNRTYSRTAIGMRDTRHYILMTVNYEDNHSVAATLNDATSFILTKGVVKAYALDGGQTSTMVMNGHTVNRPDWGNQRTQSDIIYFATALPEEVNP